MGQTLGTDAAISPGTGSPGGATAQPVATTQQQHSMTQVSATGNKHHAQAKAKKQHSNRLKMKSGSTKTKSQTEIDTHGQKNEMASVFLQNGVSATGQQIADLLSHSKESNCEEEDEEELCKSSSSGSNRSSISEKSSYSNSSFKKRQRAKQKQEKTQIKKSKYYYHGNSCSHHPEIKVHHHYHHHVHHHLNEANNVKAIIIKEDSLKQEPTFIQGHIKGTPKFMATTQNAPSIQKQAFAYSQQFGQEKVIKTQVQSNNKHGYDSNNTAMAPDIQVKQVHISYTISNHTRSNPSAKVLRSSTHPPSGGGTGESGCLHTAPQATGIRGRVTISWRDDKESCHTCGWLLSEFIRKTEPQHCYNSGEQPLQCELSTIAIKSKGSQHITLDYYLTQVDRSLSLIANNEELEAVQVLTSEIQQLVNAEDQGDTLDHYLIEKVIGKGGFSKVLLVRHKITGQLYAMKVMRKDRIKRDNKVLQIMTERRILEQIQGSNHPFIVKMHSAFQSAHYLHFVLEFCAGGELFFLISKYRRFPEAIAKFYFVEILLGIEFLHKNKIMYRDLKPENILIDLDGHVRITDFGLSKDQFGRKERAVSFCGSPEYMSPDMLAMESHGRMVDFYSLGALLYEMLTGLPPFYSNNRDEMYHNIVHQELTYPRHLSNEVVRLLKGLLCKDPERRLGAKEGFTEIKKHEFCKGIDWESLLKKRVRPPLKMNPTATCDTIKSDYFDMEYTRMSPRLSLIDDSDKESNLENSVIRGRQKRSKSMQIDPSPSSLESKQDDHSQLDQQFIVDSQIHAVQTARVVRENVANHCQDQQPTNFKASKALQIVIHNNNRVQDWPRVIENQSPTFKNFQFSLINKKKRSQGGFGHNNNTKKKTSSQNNKSMSKQPFQGNTQPFKEYKKTFGNPQKNKNEQQYYVELEDGILKSSGDGSPQDDKTQEIQYHHQNSEKYPLFIYRSAKLKDSTQARSEIGLQESGKASFPGEKVITDESPEFDRDEDEDIILHSDKKSASLHEIRHHDENDLIIDTLPSQKHQNPLQDRLKHPPPPPLIQNEAMEDKSEIVLDLRDETFSETFGGGGEQLESAGHQSPVSQKKEGGGGSTLPRHQVIMKKEQRYEIIIPQSTQDFNQKTAFERENNILIDHPFKKGSHVLGGQQSGGSAERNSANRCISMTPSREQNQKVIKDQMKSLFDHFVFKSKDRAIEKDKQNSINSPKRNNLFKRKKAIMGNTFTQEETRLHSSPVNDFFGITLSYNNQMMVLGDQDSKVLSPQGNSPKSNDASSLNVTHTNNQPSVTVTDNASSKFNASNNLRNAQSPRSPAPQSSLFKNQNLMMKRRYGEVIGNVIQERKRQVSNNQRNNRAVGTQPHSGLGSFLKAGAGQARKSGGPTLPNKEPKPNNTLSGGGATDRGSEKQHVSPNRNKLLSHLWHQNQQEKFKISLHTSPNSQTIVANKFQKKQFTASQKSPQLSLSKASSIKGPIKNSKQKMSSAASNMRNLSNSKVYAEYFQQFKEPDQSNSNSNEEGGGGGSTERSPLLTNEHHHQQITQKSQQEQSSMGIFSPTKISAEKNIESNPYCYVANKTRKEVKKVKESTQLRKKSEERKDMRNKSGERLGFFRSFDAQTARNHSKNSKKLNIIKDDHQEVKSIDFNQHNPKQLMTPGKNKLLFFKNLDEKYYGGASASCKRSLIEPQKLLKHQGQQQQQSETQPEEMQSHASSNSLQIQVNYPVITQIESINQNYHNSRHHVPLVTQPQTMSAFKDERHDTIISSGFVQMTEPVQTFNKLGVSPYVLPSSIKVDDQYRLVIDSSSPKQVTQFNLVDDCEELKIESGCHGINEVISGSEPRLQSKHTNVQSSSQLQKPEKPDFVQKLIKDRMKEVQNKLINYPSYNKSFGQKSTLMNKTQVKRAAQSPKARIPKYPGPSSLAASTIGKNTLSMSGMTSTFKAPPQTNISILDPLIMQNQFGSPLPPNSALRDVKRSSGGTGIGMQKSPLTMSCSIKGAGKIIDSNSGTVSGSGSFLYLEKVSNYNLLNDVLQQHQMHHKQLAAENNHSHQRVVTQPEIEVTSLVSNKKHQFGSESRMFNNESSNPLCDTHGSSASAKPKVASSFVGKGCQKNTKFMVASIPFTSAQKPIPNRQPHINQSNLKF